VINILGGKIATGPIEEALQRFLNVTGVCVFSVQNESADEEIHVAIETPVPIDEERLVAALTSAMPMATSVQPHFLSAFPRNEMGKTRRDVLRREVSVSNTRGERRRSHRLARKRERRQPAASP